MYTTLTTLINLLDSNQIANTGVIRWGSPVPSFGDLSNSEVGTLGLNPSNKEFVDEQGNELRGKFRRFHTLNSLGIEAWSDVDARHLQSILETCQQYFHINPYDRWFKVLDLVISGANASYYSEESSACHLDLIPYATSQKWYELDAKQRSTLLSLAGGTLGLLIRESPIKILILNGQSVVDTFQDISGIQLEKQKMQAWSLPRRSTHDVIGVAYRGIADNFAGIQLGRNLLILGFNHNLQSSFGVTKKVLQEIRKWISKELMETIL
jgi:hypothetical protein